MNDNFNTTAGWTLFAAIVALGTTIVAGEYFHGRPPEKGGFEVADAAPSEGGAAAITEMPIGQLMAAADVAKGAETFKKCTSCHNATAGGANAIGPNLHAIFGRAKGGLAGFDYSAGMKAKGGNWDFASMNEWLQNPKKYVEGTKMSFAGLSKGSDRADVIAYLNSQGSNLPMPAVEPAQGEDKPAAPTKG